MEGGGGHMRVERRYWAGVVMKERLKIVSISGDYPYCNYFTTHLPLAGLNLAFTFDLIEVPKLLSLLKKLTAPPKSSISVHAAFLFPQWSGPA